MTSYYQQAAARGAVRLDEACPGWWRQVTSPLQMDTSTDCVLGQVYGEYYLGKCQLKVRQPARHGYTLTMGRYYFGRRLLAWQKLADAWSVEITARRSTENTREAPVDDHHMLRLRERVGAGL